MYGVVSQEKGFFNYLYMSSFHISSSQVFQSVVFTETSLKLY